MRHQLLMLHVKSFWESVKVRYPKGMQFDIPLKGHPKGHPWRHLKRHLRLHVNWGFAFFFSYGVPLGKPCKVPCRVAYNLQIKPLGSLSNQLYPSGIWPWHTPPPIRITRYLKSQTSQSTNRRILCQSIERLVSSLVRGFPGMRYD